MHLLVPFILQNFKKILGDDPELWGCAIFGPKMPHLPWTKKFLVQTIIITFIYLLALFIVQNLKKILTADPELWGCTVFGPKMVHLPQTKIFVWKLLIPPTSPFHCAKKNSSSGSRVMRMRNFWAQNDPFPQMRPFSENLLMSLVSFIHAYLHAKTQSQILIY